MVNVKSSLSGDHVKICPLSHLSTHTRFALTLRTQSTSRPSKYHRLLIFRLSPLVPQGSQDVVGPELYCMESTCPHMGAPLSHAPVTIDPPAVEDEPQTPASSSSNSTARQLTDDTSEQDLIDRTLDLSLVPEMMERDMEDLVGGRTITCPWHHYDFDLITGESPVGIKACTYDVRVEGGDVWVQAPDELEDDESWEVVEVKGVSEEYSDPPPARSTTTSQPTTGQSPSTSGGNHDGSSNPTPTALPQLPKTLIQSAILILKTPNPTQKISLTRQTTSALRQGTFQSILPTKKDLALVRQTFDKGEYEAKGLRGFTPPREGLKEVDSWGGAKRGKGGNEKSRILMIHALANIEQWAIDLAWDVIARFANFEIDGKKLPVEFYLDWAKVAEDESKHFSLLTTRLEELGSFYGAHTVHAGLWESALDTQDDLLARLAIIHLVHEARGLDVNPITIKKFEKAGDLLSSRMMEIIHLDEITHVTTGHRWFTYICGLRSLDPIMEFRRLVKENFMGKIKGPFGVEDRGRAGMTKGWYEDLEGHGFGAGVGGKKEGEGDERVHPRLT